jgi:hypothetical protein
MPYIPIKIHYFDTVIRQQDGMLTDKFGIIKIVVLNLNSRKLHHVISHGGTNMFGQMCLTPAKKRAKTIIMGWFAG